jgi:bis(5'-nucleosyl)-tetraphosphatase (symmetrical)
MAIYAIGDVQGCFKPLLTLLEKISFDPKQDKLWFTGDLVNRGPHSLETIRFVKGLGKSAITVLGNHDLALLAVALAARPFQKTHFNFQDILNASDKIELISWLQHQPLLHHDTTLGYTLVHAGLYPAWDLPLCRALAKEVEEVLQGKEAITFLQQLYQEEPTCWDPTLTGWDRLRFITNCFTLMRFCSSEGELEFHTKGNAPAAPHGFFPWFAVPNRKTKDLKIIFGHWASLQGKCDVPNLFPLDTGCVWGNCLTALRLEDGIRFTESCSNTS